MFYPFKFKPVYKEYIWGGHGLRNFGRILPKDKIAESWEISCHPKGVSVIANGKYTGIPLDYIINEYGNAVIGKNYTGKEDYRFPLLVKLIDANEKLSVQVHPGDGYADTHEKGESGKSEMWYIISAKPGARIYYGLRPGISKDNFKRFMKEGTIEDCLNPVKVYPGDVFYIPPGLVHAVGEGIVLAEIQQSSDATYRVYDYNRIDGNRGYRPLHIEKALEVIDFNNARIRERAEGIKIKLGFGANKTYKVANRHFCTEILTVNGILHENTQKEKFHIYVLVEGESEIFYYDGSVKLRTGETVLIPAILGNYYMSGSFRAVKAYVPSLNKDILEPLYKAGYSYEKVFRLIDGLDECTDVPKEASRIS